MAHQKLALIITANDDFFDLYDAELTAEQWHVRRAVPGHEDGELPDATTVLMDVATDADWDRVHEVSLTGIPVVVVTGWWSPDGRYRQRVKDAGAAAYLLKPAGARTVLGVIERVAAGERGIEVIPRHMENGRDRRRTPRE